MKKKSSLQQFYEICVCYKKLHKIYEFHQENNQLNCSRLEFLF